MSNWSPVRELIAGSDFWAKFIRRAELDSTNSFIRRSSAMPPGTVVLASRQKHGHGKGKRKWYSPEGGLWFSFLLDGLFARTTPEFYVEVLNLIKSQLADNGVEARVSRPNDLVVGDKKIAGVLIEENEGKYIVGIGLNANNSPSDMPDAVGRKSTSIRSVTGKKVDRPEFLREFLARFESSFQGRTG